MTRKEKLKKALARRYIPSHEVMNAEFVGGLNYHADRLAPLHAALIEAVEALKCNETFHRLGGLDDCEPCKALAKIDEALKEMDKRI